MFFKLSLLFILPLTLNARDLKQIQESGKILAAVDGATPGFNYFKGKDLVGFEIDLMNEVSRRLGVTCEWVVKPFNTLLIGLKQDRFDLIASSHTITPDRERVADFITPAYCTGAAIVSKLGGPKSRAALAGKVVVAPVGTAYFAHLDKLTGLKKVKSVPTETDGLQDLLEGRSDAWVTDKFVALDVLKQRKELQVGEVLFEQRNALAVAKGNQTLQASLNQTLAKMVEDGTYAKLSKKYFDQDIRCR